MNEDFSIDVQPMPDIPPPDPTRGIEAPSSGGFSEGLLGSVYDTLGNIFDAAIDLCGEALRGVRNGWEQITFGRDIISQHDVGAGIHGPSDPGGAGNNLQIEINFGDLYGQGQGPDSPSPDQPAPGGIYGEQGAQEPPDTLSMSHAELSAALYGAHEPEPEIEPAPEIPSPAPDR